MPDAQRNTETRAKSPYHVALGKALRERRQQRKLTLKQMEALLEAEPLHLNYISACERGEVNLSFATLLRFCRLLEIKPSQLIRDYERILQESEEEEEEEEEEDPTERSSVGSSSP
jgi:transcriptional regulator with XRE-family HTH domain